MAVITRHGKASICRWIIEASFITKEQITDFITEYMKLDIPLEFSYEEKEEDGITNYTVNVSGCWAQNLKDIGELLEHVDYSFDDCDDYEVEEQNEPEMGDEPLTNIPGLSTEQNIALDNIKSLTKDKKSRVLAQDQIDYLESKLTEINKIMIDYFS